MKGISVAAAIAMIASGAAIAQYRPAPVTTVTEDDDGNTVRATVGSEVYVRLQQQAGTAYRWDLRNDPRLQLLAAPTTVTAPGGNRPGGLQERRFRIRVAAAGRFPMILALRSVAEGPNQVPARRIVVTIDATDARPVGPRPIDGPDTIEPLTEQDAYTEIDLPARQRMTIAVPSNNSTGYSWSLEGSSNVAILGDIVEQRPRDARIGGGGTSLIRFYGVRRGFPAEIQLRYKRPGGGRAVKTLIYRFRVI